MARIKQGLGLSGLMVMAALGVMVFASSAQAVTPQFNLGGVVKEFTVTGSQEGTGSLSIPVLKVEINCTELEVLEGLVLSGTDADARLLYKGCEVFTLPGLGASECHVSDVDTSNPSKLHITVLKALLLPVEFPDGTYGVLAEGLNIQVNFLPGTGCTLPLKNVIKGEVCFRISGGNDTSELLIKSSETIQTECPKRIVLEGLESNPVGGTFEDKLLFGVNPAFVTGSAVLTDVGGGSIGVLLL